MSSWTRVANRSPSRMRGPRSNSSSDRRRRTRPSRRGRQSGEQPLMSSSSSPTGGGASKMSSRAEPTPKTLVAAVLALTVTVLGLGGAIVAIKLRPQPVPTTAIDRSIELWQRAVITNPEDDDARVGLGMALLEAGRDSDAQGAFEEAVRLNGNNWTALLQLGL